MVKSPWRKDAFIYMPRKTKSSNNGGGGGGGGQSPTDISNIDVILPCVQYTGNNSYVPCFSLIKEFYDSNTVIENRKLYQYTSVQPSMPQEVIKLYHIRDDIETNYLNMRWIDPGYKWYYDQANFVWAVESDNNVVRKLYRDDLQLPTAYTMPMQLYYSFHDIDDNDVNFRVFTQHWDNEMIDPGYKMRRIKSALSQLGYNNPSLILCTVNLSNDDIINLINNFPYFGGVYSVSSVVDLGVNIVWP